MVLIRKENCITLEDTNIANKEVQLEREDAKGLEEISSSSACLAWKSTENTKPVLQFFCK